MEWWGKKGRGKLMATAFCGQVAGRYGSNRYLIPELTEIGWPVWPTDEKFWKKEAVRKNWNGGG